MPRPAGGQVDHYELLEHLADGAQAEVHRAKDLRSGREVVIKFPHAGVLDNPVLAARWRRQVSLTKNLDHPNIQRRLDVEDRHQEPYVVLEYASGGSLEGWINADSPLPIGQVVEWGRQLAQALVYLHALGILHRDLKTGNVMITDDMDLKLADFGAAIKASRPRPWDFPMPPEGTSGYLSPEQIIGQPGDQRSDIYGWGVVMYELLTGRLPYTGSDQVAAMESQLRDAMVPLRHLRGDIPPGLETVVLTALRRQPEQRYPNAVALLHDLDYLDGLDPADYDLSPEPAMAGVIGGSEGAALLRFALLIAGGFAGVVIVVILVSISLR
jgi:serine/threonine protein kinase